MPGKPAPGGAALDEQSVGQSVHANDQGFGPSDRRLSLGRGLVSACDMVILLHLLLLSASALWFSVLHLQSVISARRRGDFFTRFRSLLSS